MVVDVSNFNMQVMRFIGLKGGKKMIGWHEERSPPAIQA
jgi:hypothetical protein